MIKVYGKNNGFEWKMGDTVGAQIISVPMSVPLGIADRAFRTLMVSLGGIALATMFLIVAFATLAMPGSSNFIGEFMILLGTFNAKTAIGAIAFIGVVAAAFYALRLFITSMHNRVGRSVTSTDVRALEAVAIVPLVAVIIALALYPQFGLARSQRSLNLAVAPAATLSGAPDHGVGVRVAQAPGGGP